MKTKHGEVLAIIPARKRSRRLPGKNMRLFCGKPLVQWTIDQALVSTAVTAIDVSTDDPAIARLARKKGIPVPSLRPRRLATGTASLFDVTKQVLISRAGHPEYLVLLQPTSPLRSTRDIDAAFALLKKHPAADAVIGITPVADNPYRMKHIGPGGYLRDLLPTARRLVNKQTVPALYRVNGALYIIKTAAFLREKTFFPRKTLGHVMPRERSVDIDTLFDFRLAEFFAGHPSS